MRLVALNHFGNLQHQQYLQILALGIEADGLTASKLEVRNDEEGEVGDPFGREGEGPWHIARLTAAASGVEVGHIRLRYSDQEMTMRSNFKSETMADWGRDIVARKVVSDRGSDVLDSYRPMGGRGGQEVGANRQVVLF